LQELTAAAEKGLPVYVIFLAQLAWARSISLNAEVDPGFVHAVRQAQSAGVHLLGYTVYPRLPDGIDWGVSVPVEVPYLK
jgi:DNA-binding sugar fermentation-stimulating protein